VQVGGCLRQIGQRDKVIKLLQIEKTTTYLEPHKFVHPPSALSAPPNGLIERAMRTAIPARDIRLANAEKEHINETHERNGALPAVRFVQQNNQTNELLDWESALPLNAIQNVSQDRNSLRARILEKSRRHEISPLATLVRHRKETLADHGTSDRFELLRKPSVLTERGQQSPSLTHAVFTPNGAPGTGLKVQELRHRREKSGARRLILELSGHLGLKQPVGSTG
jgi:hypothetical protein